MEILRYVEANLSRQVLWRKKSGYDWHRHLLDYQKQNQWLLGIVYFVDTMG